jgi:hypothetical protein
VLVLVLFIGCAGCAYRIVRPPPLLVGPPGQQRVVQYPAYVLVHDTQSKWDAHQIKDNIVGLLDTEIVRCLDAGLDLLIPGDDRRPLQNGIEWIKNSYATLPDIAPVRIVGGFFSAIFIEKTTIIGGIVIAGAPGDPMSWFLVTRAVYLTDWVQETLGEVNAGLGHLVPWEGSFVPAFMTAPINGAIDWAQTGVITAYTWFFRELNIGVDNLIYGGEWVWGSAVSVFVPAGEPVNQAPAETGSVK